MLAPSSQEGVRLLLPVDFSERARAWSVVVRNNIVAPAIDEPRVHDGEARVVVQYNRVGI